MVDYPTLRADRAALDVFVAQLALGSAPRDRENAQHAFWLNAYNALVLWTVLEDGLDETGASVMDVDGWLPIRGSGFFFERAYVIQGMPTSLWEIEHERLRGRVMDYRDHAALNCAGRSCPPLRPELYSQKDIQDQLDDQMGRWLADQVRGARFDGETVVFSPIFSWYAHDFEFLSAGDDLCTLAARHSVGGRRERFKSAANAGCPHSFFEYDWSLNDATRPAPSGE
jgi:hypothetical protein